jgi:hypothetical protein
MIIVIGVAGFMALAPVNFLRSNTNDFQPRIVLTDPIVGSWNCLIPPAGGSAQFNDIKNIHVGGTQSEIDNAAPPSLESPTVGTWKHADDGGNAGSGEKRSLSYRQDAYQMIWDPSGNFVGTFHYFGPMSLDPSLNTLNITGTATLVDANGNEITSFPFTASCSRL